MLLRIALAFICVTRSYQHGMMLDPPSRSSLWRDSKFRNDPRVVRNYNDNQLYCGGRSAIQKLGGLCGPCGDPYEGTRENEAGGKYGLGIISRSLPDGATTLQTKVRVTAYHKGHFEFRICPHDDPTTPVSQHCLNRHLLKIQEAGDEDPTKFKLTEPFRRDYELTLILPKDIKCKQCVLQWRYRTGNSWGRDITGKSCLGCGVQEEFRNCADISIGSGGSTLNANEIDMSRRPVDHGAPVDWETNRLPTADEGPMLNTKNAVEDFPFDPIGMKDKTEKTNTKITFVDENSGRNGNMNRPDQLTKNEVGSDTQRNANEHIRNETDPLIESQIEGQKRITELWRRQENEIQNVQKAIQQENIRWQERQIQLQREAEKKVIAQNQAQIQKDVAGIERQQIQNQIATQTAMQRQHIDRTRQQQQKMFNVQLQHISQAQRSREQLDRWARQQRQLQRNQMLRNQQRLQRHRQLLLRQQVNQVSQPQGSSWRRTNEAAPPRRTHISVSRNPARPQPRRQRPNNSQSPPDSSKRETVSHVMWPWSSGIPLPRPGISSGFSSDKSDNIGNKLLLISPNPPSLRSEQNIRMALEHLRQKRLTDLWGSQFRKQKTREVTLNGDGNTDGAATTSTPPTDVSTPVIPTDIKLLLENELKDTDIYSNDFNVISPNSLEGMKLITDWTNKLVKLYREGTIDKETLNSLLSKFSSITDATVQSSTSNTISEGSKTSETVESNFSSQKASKPTNRFELSTPRTNIAASLPASPLMSQQQFHQIMSRRWRNNIRAPFGAVFRSF